MDSKNKNVLTVKEKNGKEVEYEILFEFYNEKNKKNYVGYTDNKKDEFDNLYVYASIYDPTLKNKTLQPIETEEEWDAIETIFSKLPDLNKEGE